MILLGERLWALLVGIAITQPAPAADPVDRCLADHERAQLARERDDLVGARRSLQLCADPACPPLVEKDCTTWLAEVEATLPSVDVVVLIDGTGTAPDELWIDDVVAPAGDGAQPINPGTHRFRVRKTIDGEAVERELERTIAAAPGLHVIRIELGAPRPAVPPPRQPPSDGPRDPDRRALRIAGYSTLAVGLVLGAVGLGTGTSGLVARKRALDECAPFCASDRADSIRARILVADIVTPIAAALLVGSIALLVVGRRKHTSQRASVRIEGDRVRF